MKLFTIFVWPPHEGLVTEMAKKAGQEQTVNFLLSSTKQFQPWSCSKFFILSIMISVAGASQPVFCCGLTRRPRNLRGVLFWHRFDSICWKVCDWTISFKKSLALKFPKKSMWERELGKRKTVRYGYKVVANMVFVQGRTSGKILTNNP